MAHGAFSLSDLDDAPKRQGAFTVDDLESPAPSPVTLNTKRGGFSGTLPPAKPAQEPLSRVNPKLAIAAPGIEAGEKIAQDVGKVKTAGKELATAQPERALPYPSAARSGLLPPPPESPDQARREEVLAQGVEGAGNLAAPLMLPAAVEAPVSAAAGILGSYGTSKLAGYGTKKAGGGPEAQHLAEALGFWAPLTAGALVRPEGGIDISPEGSRAAVTGFGGRVGAGVAVTPEGVTLRGKVGPFEGSKTFQRGPTQTGIEPPTIEADPATEALVNAQRVDSAADRMSKGLSPTPAPPPPPKVSEGPLAPTSVKQGHISPEDVQKFASAVATLPPNIRAQAVQEAHGTLAQVLLEQGQNGPVVLPDGTLALIKDQAAAEKTALGIINSAVKEHDKAAESQSESVGKSGKVSESQGQGGRGGKKIEPTPPGPSRLRAQELAKTQTGKFSVEDLTEGVSSGNSEAPQRLSENDNRGNGQQRSNTLAGEASSEPGRTGQPAGRVPVPAPEANAGEVPKQAEIQTTGKEVPVGAGNGKESAVESPARPLSKGDSVTLAKDIEVSGKVIPAGTRARINYVHPNNLLVRAVTEDGTKISRGVSSFAAEKPKAEAKNVPQEQRGSPASSGRSEIQQRQEERSPSGAVGIQKAEPAKSEWQTLFEQASKAQPSKVDSLRKMSGEQLREVVSPNVKSDIRGHSGALETTGAFAEGEILPPSNQLEKIKTELRGQYPGSSEEKIDKAAREQLAFENSPTQKSAENIHNQIGLNRAEPTGKFKASDLEAPIYSTEYRGPVDIESIAAIRDNPKLPSSVRDDARFVHEAVVDSGMSIQNAMDLNGTDRLAKELGGRLEKTINAKHTDHPAPKELTGQFKPSDLEAPEEKKAEAPADGRDKSLEAEIEDLKEQAAKVSEEFSLKSLTGYDPHSPLRAKYNELLKQAHAKEDELAKLRGEPTRAEKKDLQEKAAAKAFADRPKEALKYGDHEQSQHWQVLEPDYIAKRFADKVKQYERAVPEKQAEVAELKPGTTKHTQAEANLKYWKQLLKGYQEKEPRLAQTFKTEYTDLVKKAVSQGRPVPDAVIQQKPEFVLSKSARERYEKGRHTSFANKSAAVNDTMQKEEGFKVKRQDGKPITDAQIKEISSGVDDVVEVLGPEIRDMMRGTDLTIAHTSGTHPFLSDAGGLYHPVDRTVSAGIKDFLGRPVKALAHELGHWLDFESGRALNVKAYISSKGGASKETKYVSEADRNKPLYELARRTMTDTRAAERMVKTVKLSDLPDAERAKVERMKVVLGPYWRDARELWARMFEQHIATKLGRESTVAETVERYRDLPAWWTAEAWTKLAPMFDDALKIRMDAMRERYAPKAEETAVVPSEPTPVVEKAALHREVISIAKKEVAAGSRLAGVDGSDTKLLTSDGERPAKYRVVEAGKLVTSHNPQTFAKNSSYPAGVQERAYDTSKEAQARVIQQSQQYDPNYTINTNPDAVNGPPIITPDGIVLGGNSRAMSTARLYKAGSGNRYKSALLAQAGTFGVDKDAIRDMKEPVLVREVEAPKTADGMRALGSALNKSMTGALGVSERAVSAGRAISRDTLANISGMLDGVGKDASLRDLLRERGKDVLAALVKDGAITERERPQFVDTGTGGLSEEGKTFVERALLGSVVDDPRLMDSTPKSVLNKLDGSLAALSSIAPRTDAYNVLPLIREALREHGEIARRGSSVEDYLSQGGLFASDRDPAVDALTRLFAEKSTAVRERIRRFSEDANFDVQGQGTLGLIDQPSPAKAFNDAFGANLTEEQLENSILRAVQAEPTIESNVGEAPTVRPTEAGAGNLQRSEAGEPRPSGETGTTAPEKSRSESKTGNELNLFTDESGEFTPAHLGEAAVEATGAVGEYLRDVAKHTHIARDLQRGLETLDTQKQADILRGVKMMKELSLPHADDEAIYNHLENPDEESLSPKQDDVLEKDILPLQDANAELYTELTKGGIPIENYVHRVVKGKGGVLDKIARGLKSFGRGSSLSKSAPQTKHRTYMVLENQSANANVFDNVQRGTFSTQAARPGERIVVSIKGGQVTAWRNGEAENIGGISHTQEGNVFEDKDGNIWNLKQATTKEIEANTETRYYHSALASTIASNIQLNSAVRAMRFLEAFKASPEFKETAFQLGGKGNPPEGWKTTNLPQFAGYAFEPRTAEVLDWQYDRMRQGNIGALEQVGKLMRISMLLNPIMHPMNVAASWAMEKGATGLFMSPFHRAAWKSGNKAIKAVLSKNQDFLDALDAGAPLQSHQDAIRDIHKLFFDQLGAGLDKNEPWALKAAKALGIEHGNLLNLLKLWPKLTHQVAFSSGDILFLQSAYQYQMEHPGVSMADALKESGRINPEYRVPTRIFDSHLFSKIMTNRWTTIFGPYHYSLMKSFAEVGKSALGAQPPTPGRTKADEVAKGWDRIALIALGMVAMTAIGDELAKKLTGDKHAKLRRAGPFGIVDSAMQVAEHKQSVSTALQRVVTPAPQTKAAAELAFNREFYAGHQIYDPHADWKTQTEQIGRYLLGELGMVGQVEKAQTTEQKHRLAWQQVGIQMAKTRAEKTAADIAMSKVGTQAESPDDQEHRVARREILDQLRKGNSKPLDEAQAKHELTHKQVENLRHRARMTPLEDTVHGFSLAEVRRVYDAAKADGNQEEMKMLERVKRQKFLRLMSEGRGGEARAVSQ